MRKRISLDANIILRYVLCDIPEQAQIAGNYIDSGCAYVCNEVIEECVYVLKSFYKSTNAEISDTFTELLKTVEVDDAEIINIALQHFKEQSDLSYVDCVLLARHECYGEPICTFDKDLQKALTAFDATT